jgi:hypothetical protein
MLLFASDFSEEGILHGRLVPLNLLSQFSAAATCLTGAFATRASVCLDDDFRRRPQQISRWAPCTFPYLSFAGKSY